MGKKALQNSHPVKINTCTAIRAQTYDWSQNALNPVFLFYQLGLSIKMYPILKIICQLFL